MLAGSQQNTKFRDPSVHTPAAGRRRPRVVVAVLAAGAVPALLINVFVLYGLNRDGTQLVDFMLHLIPLALGAWVATAWWDKRPGMIALLGVIAGAVEALVMVAIFSSTGQQLLISLFDAYTVPAVEDYLAVPATGALFIAGGLIVDRRKRQQASATTAQGHLSGETQPVRRKESDGLPNLLIHPATAAFVGFAGFALDAYSALGSG